MKRRKFFKALGIGFGGAVLLKDWKPPVADTMKYIRLKPGEIRSMYLPPKGREVLGVNVTFTNPTDQTVSIPMVTFK